MYLVKNKQVFNTSSFNIYQTVILAGVMKRMVPSIMLVAAGNKVLVELKRKVKQIWEGK